MGGSATPSRSVKFVGDLSAQDAHLLERYARGARSILEFGAGGSTQIIAQAMPEGARFLSLDTEPAWIAATEEHLRRLGVADCCLMLPYESWRPGEERYDLVFDDGLGDLRRDFAMRSFPLLAVGGSLLFHDTRRRRDVRNVLALVERFFDEIEHVHLNERVEGVSSNITVVRKKKRERYVNWNVAEKRPSWASGRGSVPESFWQSDPGARPRGGS